MPIHHEKVDKNGVARGSSRNRNVQREESLDRRPVITQEKPAKRNVSSTRPKVTDRVKVPSDIKLQEVQRVQVKRTTASRPSLISRDKSKDTEKTNKKTIDKPKEMEKTRKRTVNEKSVPPKISPRTSKEESSKQIPESKPRIGRSINKAKLPDKISLNKQGTNKEKLSKKEVTKDLDKSGNSSNSVSSDRRGKHDRTRTRTLCPSEVKLVSKPIIEDEKIVGQLKSRTSEEATESKSEEDVTEKEDEEYEDDFEDYESDFEDDSEIEANDGSESNVPCEAAAMKPIENEVHQEITIMPEFREKQRSSRSALRRVKPHEILKDLDVEKKMDSGSYHILPGHQKRELDEIKAAIQEENARRKNVTLGDADEGFLEETEKPIASELSNELLDFAGAGRREKKRESIQKLKRRGDVLSQMITLDAVSYMLMEIPSVPYDVFMKSYGRSNTLQTHAQTNEDDCEEEIQTEDIELRTKWTQAPATLTSKLLDDGTRQFTFSKQEHLGVGCDENDGCDWNDEGLCHISTAKINQFLLTAGKRVCLWLESKSQHQVAVDKQLTSELSCCNGKVVLKANDAPDKSWTDLVTYASGNNNLVLSVHKSKPVGSIIYVWTVQEPSAPLNVLSCRQEVKCASFGPGRGFLIFAGACDGSINLWDVRESLELHQRTNSPGRSPTYSTAEIFKSDGHLASVVALEILNKDVDDFEVDFTPLQICSMDEGGIIIVWTMVQHSGFQQEVPNADLGLAPWGRIRLVKTFKFDANGLLPKDMALAAGKYTALQVLKQDNNTLLIGLSSGAVIHSSTKGSLLNPKYFRPINGTRPSAVQCLAVYPSDQRYFLVGCSDGSIRLHKTMQVKPLMNLHWNLEDTTPSSSITMLQWLPSKPCLFFCLDSAKRVHVWNLAVSDIYPQLTVAALKNPITCFTVLRPKRLGQNAYMVIGRGDGSVEVHVRKDDFRCKSMDEYKKERKMFQRYVNRGDSGHEETWDSLNLSPSHHYLKTQSIQSNLQIVNGCQNNRCLMNIKMQRRPDKVMSFSTRKRYLKTY